MGEGSNMCSQGGSIRAGNPAENWGRSAQTPGPVATGNEVLMRRERTNASTTNDEPSEWCETCQRTVGAEGCPGCGDPLETSGAALAGPEFELPTLEQSRRVRLEPHTPLSEIFGPDEKPVPIESLATRRERYQSYLRSPHWESMRKWALERAGYACQVCNGDDESLQVHHRTYDNLGHEQPTDLIVLCGTCHGTFHRSGRLAA